MGSQPPAPRAIGPYHLDQLLGRGGMAEVYRARRSGPGGFEKVLALKRILPSYAKDPRLVGRFLDEARLCARLGHSNLVQVVDFGAVDGEYYLVMEWVDGSNLFAILRDLAERGQRLPVEATAYVVAEAAAGLDEAHGLKDEAGRPLGLVHRDISPQNILLSKKGDVKVSDFGIAKALGSSVKTAAGVQIGKVCYMSPEQARQLALDARADVYALGVVLWECLTGRPLFPRSLDAAALAAVLEPRVAPPSTFAPVPAALDAATMSALAPAREARTPSADAFGRELRIFLHSVAPGFGQRDLAALLADCWAAAAPSTAAPEVAALSTVTYAVPPGPGAPDEGAKAEGPTRREVPAARRPAPEPGVARAAPAPAQPVVQMPRLPMQPAVSTEAAKARASTPTPSPPSAAPAPPPAAPAVAAVPTGVPATRADAVPRPRRKGRGVAGCLLAILAVLVLCAAGIGLCAWKTGFFQILRLYAQ